MSRGTALEINIPLGGFSEELSTSNIEFSKRGSLLLDGRRLNALAAKQPLHPRPPTDDPSLSLNPSMNERPLDPRPATDALPAAAPAASLRSSSRHSTKARRDRPPAKMLSTDEEVLSEKVRAFYAAGTDELATADSSTHLATQMGSRWHAALRSAESNPSLSRATSTTDVTEDANGSRHPSMTPSASLTYLVHSREEHELAGGLEDWKDVDNADVDRYGFIVAKAPTPSVDGADELKPTKKLTRVSTSLQLASETPRRKHTIRRSPSSAHGSTRSGHSKHSGPDEMSARPLSSQSAYHRSNFLSRSPSLHVGTPGAKNRRLMASAMDMLTLPQSAQPVVENGHVRVLNTRARRKELEREEKWRKMALPAPVAQDPKTGRPVVGAGSERGYTFDTSSPKLIERTWKGIPDKWRATAWYSFLSASASRRNDGLRDGELTDLFHSYQTESSPDDIQIDIDVPRTISAHIMFRRRYRGGQRLLFRVLHAMSLHFVDTGYVQGMAALAVTLLAYYDEEKAFIMLVRMWELRGLGELYKAGFKGLMTALDDFERSWLGQGEVAQKLAELNIGPTAYGTRWYLTLFNYTIPFPAQLRVWDVFLLLGDDTSPRPPPDSHLAPAALPPSSGALASSVSPFGTTLDVLHASSAALIDGMRDILLESDFENGMKVLTSWIPIQDEDLFMRIARAEWKMHLKRDPTRGSAR